MQNMIMADEEVSNHSSNSDQVVGSSVKSGQPSPVNDMAKEEEVVKPSLSFSIARLISSPAEDQRSDNKSPALSSSGPSSPVSSIPGHPIQPIPMWPPTSQHSRLPNAFPGFIPSTYSPNDSHFNQMLRNVLHHSANETVSTLMRHYQQLYGAHPGLLPPSPPLINQTAHLQHKVDILRSAAAASLQRPLIPAPHHPHGKRLITLNIV